MCVLWWCRLMPVCTPVRRRRQSVHYGARCMRCARLQHPHRCAWRAHRTFYVAFLRRRDTTLDGGRGTGDGTTCTSKHDTGGALSVWCRVYRTHKKTACAGQDTRRVPTRAPHTQHNQVSAGTGQRDKTICDSVTALDALPMMRWADAERDTPRAAVTETRRS